MEERPAGQEHEQNFPPAKPHGTRGIVTGLLVLGMIGAAGAYWYSAEIKRSNAAPVVPAPAGAPPPPAVTVGHPLQTEITEWSEYTGQFAAVEYVELRARVSGYLTAIHFQDGQMVKKGDLLFEIDPRPFLADIQQAEANLERDKAQRIRATLDLKRSSELAQKNYTPQQQLDQARASADASAATVKADEALLSQARLNLEFTRITAPVSGRVGSHQVSVGNLVVGGASGTTTLLTTVVSLDPINFTFDVSEADQLAYKRGIAAGTLKSARDSVIPVEAKLVDEKVWSRTGRVDFVDNQLNKGAGTLRLRAIFPNADTLLTPGQFARVRVPTSAAHTATLIPDRAVVTDQAHKMVMTVKADGTIEPRPVTVGPTYQGLRVVRTGLGADDTIIIDGLMRARPGSKVTPQPGTIALDPHAD